MDPVSRPRLPPARTRRGQRGSVLMIVAVMGVLAMGFWALALRGTHDAIRDENFVLRRQDRTESVLPALAQVVELLHSGRPPEDPYACLVTLVAGANESTWHCAVTATSQGDQDHWLLEAHLATEEEQETLPPAPVSFGG
jgi:hypothetical protein